MVSQYGMHAIWHVAAYYWQDLSFLNLKYFAVPRDDIVSNLQDFLSACRQSIFIFDKWILMPHQTISVRLLLFIISPPENIASDNVYPFLSGNCK